MKSDIFTTDPNIDTMHLYWASEKPEKKSFFARKKKDDTEPKTDKD